MSDELKICPVCKSSECKATYEPQNSGYFFQCRSCGYFIITDSALCCNYGYSHEESNVFSGYIRNNSTKKYPILLKTDILAKLREIILPYKKIPVADRINQIINYVGNLTTIGEQSKIDMDYDFTLFYCKGKPELYALLNYAEAQSLINWVRPIYPMSLDKPAEQGFPHVVGIELTYQGWQRFEANQKINVESKSAFVAMSFDKDLDDVFYKSIAEACKICDFIPTRVDKSEHNDKICDKIIAEIKQARFVIAEFTRQKHGVYFEAGYAFGLGLPVIWCCREDDKDKLHFDTRQYNHIIWTTLEDFKEKLVNRIKATI